MNEIIVLVGLFWVCAVTVFFIFDVIKEIRDKKMSQWNSVGAMGVASQSGVYAAQQQTGTNINKNIVVETIHSGGKLHLNNQGVVWTKPNGSEVDISKAAEIFWFFLAQHPEIVEQFNAIEKIKES